MRVPRFLASAAITALAVTGSVFIAASPAAASGSPYCPGLMPASGTVSGTVVQGIDDWHYNDATGSRTFALVPSNGDADLAVFGSDCATVLCSSALVGPDACTTTATGRVYVRVHYYAGLGSVSYTLNGPTATALNGYPSDDCATGTTLAEGFAGGSYVRVRATNAGPSETWVCARADGAGLSVGGKFVVTGAGLALPALPSTDTLITSCASTGGNTVPGPHPALSGGLGDPNDPSYLPFLLDSWAGNGEAWVCVGVGSVKVRAKVSTGASPTPPNVTFQQDAPGPHTTEPPVLTVPSAQCQAAPSSTRVTDVTNAGVRSYLYLWQAAPSVLKICVRTQGLANSGGVVTVDTSNAVGALPNVTVGSNTTGCTLSVARLDNPVIVEVRRSATGAIPASTCLTVGATTVRVTATAGNGQPPASVTWTPDPGTL